MYLITGDADSKLECSAATSVCSGEEELEELEFVEDDDDADEEDMFGSSTTNTTTTTAATTTTNSRYGSESPMRTLSLLSQVFTKTTS